MLQRIENRKTCPQMTQITQIETRTIWDVICVNLRDLRENQSNVPTGRSFKSRQIYDLAASSIQHPASSIEHRASSIEHPGTGIEVPVMRILNR